MRRLGMARRQAWRRVARAVADAGVRVVSAWLLYACGSSLVGVLVDSALKLLQELINVQQITLSPEVRKRQRVWVMHWWMSRLSNHCATLTIVRHAATRIAACAATENWKLHSLKTHEPLTDIVVGVRVNGSALGVTEELVKSIVGGTLPDLVVVVQLLALVDGIVNRSIS